MFLKLIQIEKKIEFSCKFDWRLWMNGFVKTFLNGECWYLFNEIQPQYLYGK